MILPKVITAGPRGNKCKKCEEKTKAPDVLLKVVTEFNRFSGHLKQDNYCPKCGQEELNAAISTLKKMIDVLEHGPSDDSDLGSRKVRSV
jgi:Zn finger protein HypA/HybF involved in hydrogenase expression